MSKKIWLLDLVVSVFLPWLIYDQLHQTGMSETPALIWSAVPPLVWSVVELLWHRRLDAISLLSLLGIAVSIGLMLMGGNPRWVLVRESLVTGVLGMMALLSLLLKKTAIYYLARAMVAREGDRVKMAFEARMNQPNVIRAMNHMTLLWGGGMVAECVVRSWMALTLPMETVLLVSPIVFYVVMGLLALSTLAYRKHLQKAV